MLHIGCHLSPSEGLLNMAKTASSIGADTFQFFSRNPRGSKSKALDEADASAMNAYLREQSFAPVLVHAPYTLNPCAEKPETAEFAELVMRDDLLRCTAMKTPFYNFHPGSHVGQGEAVGIEKTAALLNRILSDETNVTVLIETMSGQGSEIGGTFDSVRAIIDRVDASDRIGVCFDTCHVFQAGFDLVNDLDGVLDAFDRTIGLDRLHFVHLNDSMFECGMHKDRHAAIGKGCIGLDAMQRIVSHPALRALPFCLETPHENLSEYAEEIALVRRMRE
ncbi:MAG: deoxyribonuclease IV [Clostridia bacterium]|nr:deoxyribonuclease IV [Clostridia bacterium]